MDIPVSAALVFVGPLALLFAGLAPAGWADRHPQAMGRVALTGALLAFAGALLAAIALATGGPVTWSVPFFSVPGGALVGVSLYYDQVSAVMLLLVSFVGSIVVGYSRNDLAGDPRQGGFCK